MEYQVPQFIEVEDKIFGPLTLKQFIFLAGGIGLTVIAVLYLPLFFAILAGLAIMGFSLALAFYKVNNKSFVDVLGAGLSFYTKDRMYLWKKEDKPDAVAPTPTQITREAPEREKLTLSGNKLHDLAWSLDIKDKEGGEPQ